MNIFQRNGVNGVLDAITNIFDRKVGVELLDDFREANPFADQFQYVLHGNTRSAYARLAEVNGRIDSNAMIQDSSP
jgi:hypothetical protein